MKKQIIIAGLVSVIMTPPAPRKHSLRGWFWRGGVSSFTMTGGGVPRICADNIYTLNSILCYCHAVRDNNITLRAAQ